MAHHHGAFGDDTFGRFAEKTAGFFGVARLTREIHALLTQRS